MADARTRDQLEHGVEHAEPGAQHGHDHDVARDAAALRGAERRLDDAIAGRQVAHGFGGEQHADAGGKRRNSSGPVCESRSVSSASCTSGC